MYIYMYVYLKSMGSEKYVYIYMYVYLKSMGSQKHSILTISNSEMGNCTTKPRAGH